MRLQRGVLFVLAALWAEVVWAAGSGGTGEAHHGAPWLLLALSTVNFALFVWIVFRWGGPMMRAALVGYGEEVREAIAQAEASHAEAEAAVRGWREREARLPQERERLHEEIVTVARAERVRRLEGARATAERLVREGELLAAQEREQARALVRDELVDLAVTQATERLRQTLQPGDQEKFVARFLEEVAR